MTILEKKVDAIAHLLLAGTPEGQKAATEWLQELMSGKRVVGTIDEEIDAALCDLGISERLRGHECVHEAVRMVVEDPSLAHKITTVLYPEVARKFDTTKARAERCIRHAVECCFIRCDLDVVRDYFGNLVSPSKGMLTNGEFISRLAHIVRERVG